MARPKINPCPFCGHKAKLMIFNPDYETITIGCTNPKCDITMGKGFFSDEEAINHWNRRVTLSDKKPKYTDISKLPNGTFFYVNNGAWTGYVTTEDGNKICYAGVTKKNPTKEYIRHFIINDTYELNINILQINKELQGK